jgi:hypothetical protein
MLRQNLPVLRPCVGCGVSTRARNQALAAVSRGQIHLLCPTCVAKQPSASVALLKMALYAARQAGGR